jgi:MFS transporter, DHA2 family, multidrug resistance protein
MAVVSIRVLLGPIAGPILGGRLIDTFSWPWIFAINLPIHPDHGTIADPHVWIPVTIGPALIGGFVIRARYRADHPLIDLRLFKNREVTAANSAMLLCVVAHFGVELLVPNCLQHVLHQTPLQSGTYLIPEPPGAMLAMPIAGGVGLLNQETKAVTSVVVSRKAPAPTLPIGLSRATVGSH